MMKTFLIVYKLNDYKTDYSIISEKIKSYSNWAKPFDRTWLINTDRSAVEIRDGLAASINRRGRILVIDVSGSAWATSMVDNKVNDWMHKNV